VLVASKPHRIEMQVLAQRPPLPPSAPPSFFSGVPDPFNFWKKSKDTTTNNNNNNNGKKPILLFLHGSFHGAWCYAEHWFDHFVQLGYPVAALSWRGTGATCAGPGVSKVKIEEHVHDLRTVLYQLPSLVFGKDELTADPRERGVVLVSHSFGGLAVMKMLEMYPELLSPPVAADAAAATAPPPIVGVVTMCSVPPSGNGRMTLRYLRRSWKQSWKITAGFALKQCCDDAALCRDLFFGGGGDNDDNDNSQAVSDDDLKRYQAYFRRDSEATIDLVDLAKQLPIAKVSKMDGTAPFVSMLPPCLVVGASRDSIVDREGVLETARYFGVLLPSSEEDNDTNEDDTSKDESGLVIVESPHDVMLGNDWRNGARAIERWLSRHVL
jgi:pimeloyl-ACP methyl ester carboxylesterase